MEWLSTPVTIPAGVVVLFFTLFSGVTGALLRLLFKLWERFFLQQDAMLKALNVADRTAALAEKAVDGQ